MIALGNLQRTNWNNYHLLIDLIYYHMKIKFDIFNQWNLKEISLLHEMQDKWCFCVVIKACINHNWFLSLFLSKSYFLASFFPWLFGSTAIYILLPRREASVAQWCEYCHSGQWCHIECNLFDIRSLIKKIRWQPNGRNGNIQRLLPSYIRYEVGHMHNMEDIGCYHKSSSQYYWKRNAKMMLPFADVTALTYSCLPRTKIVYKK